MRLCQLTPCLPPGARTPARLPAVSYVVGRGGKLNPGGVFVVERPGLGDFLRRIMPFSEVGWGPPRSRPHLLVVLAVQRCGTAWQLGLRNLRA